MAAYAAVNSLKNTIEDIRDSSRICFVPEMMIEVAYKELQPLEEILQRLDSTSKSKSRKMVNVLDGQIKEAIWKFEDLVEVHIVSQLATQFESPLDKLKLTSMRRNVNRRRARRRKRRICDYLNALCSNKLPVEEEGQEEEESKAANQIFFIDLQGLQLDVDSFVKTVRDMEKKYMYELDNLPEDESAVSSPCIDFNGKKSKMVGLSDVFTKARERLTRSSEGRIACSSLVGMAGIGKTTLAKVLFQDPLIRSHFECRIWVTVGRIYQFNKILECIVSQLDPNYMVTSEILIAEWLKERLKGKRCLIVLDDVWETQVWDRFISILMPDENTSVGNLRILLTARERNVDAHIFRSMPGFFIVVRFMKKEESEDLLCEKVFGEGSSFPPELEKAGKKIAKNCEGLPLMIVTVADHLSKVDKDPQYWNEVAERRNSVFVDAYDKIYEVLLPSYEYLPQHLKLIFLYIGMFPQDYEIPRSKLINLLTAEGFVALLDGRNRKTPEDSIKGFIQDLIAWHNIVIAVKKTKHWDIINLFYSVKSCRLHSAFRHLCKREARKNKSFHILECHGLEEEAIQGERRLCVHSNNLLAIKQVYNSVQSADCASTARSLLCLGPYHQYAVPILDVVGFKLLRVLDALKIRFYNFPIQILKLVQLRYLALTYNKNLPPSISKLFNLQFLIINPHTNIKICGDPLLIPVQIWDMKELKHIEIMGSCLPNPTSAAALEQLSTLVAVSATSCTWEVLGKTPNLTKLGIQIEWGNLPEDDRINPLSCFDHISKLKKLDTLKCNIVNPRFDAPLNPLSTLPSTLRKLHLSGLGYPWEYMKVIGSLPNLEVLKLRCYAFRGLKWEAEDESFLSLEFLLIEDTDLVQWKPGRGSFPELSYLSMKHCYKLKEVHCPYGNHVARIELLDCNPLAVTRAQYFAPNKATGQLHVTTQSSYHV